jgi:DNA-binding NtrC family response regulator
MAETPVRILVGDEEPLVRRFVGDALRDGGYDVEAVGGETEFLRLSRERPFGLLILDYLLALRSGFEGILSARDRDAALPVILMAAGGPGRRVEPVAFTCRVRLLRKPFGARDLREAVERALRGPGY